MPAWDTGAALLERVRHPQLELGAFVENDAHDVLEGLSVHEAAHGANDGAVAVAFREVRGLARFALQVPVDEWDLTPPSPAAHSFIGLLVLPPAKEHGGSQDILGHATEEQHKQSHLVA